VTGTSRGGTGGPGGGSRIAATEPALQDQRLADSPAVVLEASPQGGLESRQAG